MCPPFLMVGLGKIEMQPSLNWIERQPSKVAATSYARPFVLPKGRQPSSPARGTHSPYA
jgi:hypothetical protein